MGPQSFDHDSPPDARTDVPCNCNCNGVAEAFLELFELLEEYAPVWYTEQHHDRALAALALLQKS